MLENSNFKTFDLLIKISFRAYKYQKSWCKVSVRSQKFVQAPQKYITLKNDHNWRFDTYLTSSSDIFTNYSPKTTTQHSKTQLTAKIQKFCMKKDQHNKYSSVEREIRSYFESVPRNSFFCFLSFFAFYFFLYFYFFHLQL